MGKQTRAVYTCFFDLPWAKCSTDSYFGESSFEKGFWIDEECDLCGPEDRKYWVPPTSITYIELTYVEVEDGLIENIEPL